MHTPPSGVRSAAAPPAPSLFDEESFEDEEDPFSEALRPRALSFAALCQHAVSLTPLPLAMRFVREEKPWSPVPVRVRNELLAVVLARALSTLFAAEPYALASHLRAREAVAELWLGPAAVVHAEEFEQARRSGALHPAGERLAVLRSLFAESLGSATLFRASTGQPLLRVVLPVLPLSALPRHLRTPSTPKPGND